MSPFLETEARVLVGGTRLTAIKTEVSYSQTRVRDANSVVMQAFPH